MIALAFLVAAAAPPASFALVVGNNRSLQDAQPDLRYADDDALKYGAAFRSFSASDDVRVLTRVDAESRALFGAEIDIAGTPSKSSVDAAALDLAVRVREAKQSGKATVMYFVFAGHGGDDHGKGFLELEDGRVGKAELERWLDVVGADTTHVILDSCNSFFVVNPRRPGGRVWATAADASDGLKSKNTDVGVFLSTSADAQVFEWSQLQSGVFSHAVRSGLLGAADADGDGIITYEELDAFVATSTKNLDNSDYRPHLFVRPPKASAVFADLREARGRRVTLDGFPRRTTVRDARGVRFVDVTPEPGFAPSILIPAQGPVTIAASVERDGRFVESEREIFDDTRITPGELTAATTVGSPRGSASTFQQLFAAPYGPKEKSAYLAMKTSEPPAVYGLTRAQEDRLLLQLRIVSDEAERERFSGAEMEGVIGGVGVALGAALVGYGAFASAAPRANNAGAPYEIAGAALGVVSLADMGQGLYDALSPSYEEKLYRGFADSTPRNDAERKARVARAIDKLTKSAAAEKADRDTGMWVGTIGGGIIGVGGVALLAGIPFAPVGDGSLDAHPANKAGYAAMSAVAIAASAALVGFALITADGTRGLSEQMLDLIEKDPESVTVPRADAE